MYFGVVFKVNWYNIVWDLKELSKNIIWSSDFNESIGKLFKKGLNEKEIILIFWKCSNFKKIIIFKKNFKVM